MPEMKSSVSILMGVIILISDIAWLLVGASYTYVPWLILGIVIFLAALVWLAMDISLITEAKAPLARKDQQTSSTTMKK